ncbi:MAG TPA: DUF4230 domain-containing protein [Pilimelia sp.]|nr:DUF4230 domain-containing protein [Pilimelia sp.]
MTSTDDVGADPPSEPPPSDPPPPAPRRRPLLILGLVALVAAVAVIGQAADLWPRLRNPFAEQTTDRSQPPLLLSIKDLSRYVAAEGNYQVVVDLERNRDNVPEFLLNQRTLFVGAGEVEAYVDFGGISDGAVKETADGRGVTLTLPPPQLGEPHLDLERSYVFAEQRGLLNRLGEVFAGDPDRQRKVYQLAEERIGAAARDSGIAARAEENTRKMLAGLLRSLGYETVTITFAPAP